MQLQWARRRLDLRRLDCLYMLIKTCFFPTTPLNFLVDLLKKRTGTDTVLILIYIYPYIFEILTLIYMLAKLMTCLKFPEMVLIWQSSRQDSTLCGTPCLADRIGGLWLKLLKKGISPSITTKKWHRKYKILSGCRYVPLWFLLLNYGFSIK